MFVNQRAVLAGVDGGVVVVVSSQNMERTPSRLYWKQ